MEGHLFVYLCAGIVLVTVCAHYASSQEWRAKYPRPPGPRGLPLVGNIFDLPPQDGKDWEFWAKHKSLYGPVSSIRFLGRTIVIINDRKSAIDIMNGMASKTAGRPVSVFAGEFAGFQNSTTMTPDKKRFRTHRKHMNNVLGSNTSVAKYFPIQELDTCRLLKRILDNPHDFASHLRRQAGAFILKVTYDYNIAPEGLDPLVELAESGLEKVAYASKPGNWLVDSFPFLRHYPAWLPGGGFKKEGLQISAFVAELVERPLAFTLHQRKIGVHGQSYVSDLLDQNEDYGNIAWTSSGMYLAGTDTTVASLKAFILAMTLFPQVQRKAQEEIDRVVGTDRLPTMADREQLPYLNALLMENLRWHTAAVLAIPHSAEEDIVYNGMLIPKGATLIPNVWLFNNDETIYPNPKQYEPERFLPKESGYANAPNPWETNFGFGRRVCPGRFIADASVYITATRLLAAFKMTKPLDSNGQPIEPVLNQEIGLVSHPGPFQANFTLRDPKYEDMIRAITDANPESSGDEKIWNEVSWAPTPSVYL